MFTLNSVCLQRRLIYMHMLCIFVGHCGSLNLEGKRVLWILILNFLCRGELFLCCVTSKFYYFQNKRWILLIVNHDRAHFLLMGVCQFLIFATSSLENLYHFRELHAVTYIYHLDGVKIVLNSLVYHKELLYHYSLEINITSRFCCQYEVVELLYVLKD